MNTFYKTMSSPLGRLNLVANERGLLAVLWENDDPRRVPLGPPKEDRHHPVLEETQRQLGEYFAGKLRAFSLEFAFRGTEFQRKVWAALTTIPYGETRSYAQVARQIGRPNAVRAVGAASGKNPVSIIIPCHRVVGSNGKLTGFAGGLEAKAYLLRREANGARSESDDSSAKTNGS